MSKESDQIDRLIEPLLTHAKKVEATDPQKAAQIRRNARRVRVELAKMEAVALSMGYENFFGGE